MNADWHAKLCDAFLRVADLAAPQRAAYLDQACADDPAFRAAVEAMLAKDPGEPRPRRVAHFDIRGVLGEGGMGVVYLAQREHHPRDIVALKVVRHGMDTKEVLARFEAEQKALSLLSHPNIARLFEAGVTTEGSPYFTMEYVPGVPITEFCDANGLDMRARLGIFSELCGAVEHAHKRGIIHRDLKPTNVLIGVVDGKPAPKIIDFGVAKALNYTLSERTLFTEQGRLVGTPEYMSPEQAGKAATEVDHRSDIYSLGVLLYELLAGAPPLDGKTLREKAWNEMVRTIREFEPPKPSTRRRTLLAGGQTDKTARGADIDVLPRVLREDLDQITLKAIEKQPAHRYQAAAELADIIQRYLRGEPIPWRVSSRWVRAERHSRRHRKAYVRALAAAIALALILTAGRSIRARQRVDSLAEKAALAARDSNWNLCIEKSDSALTTDSTLSRAMYASAFCRYKRVEELSRRERRNRPDLCDALAAVDRYLTRNIKDNREFDFWNLKCAILLQLEPPDLDAAAKANGKALSLSPEVAEPHIFRAAIFALNRDFQRALQASQEGGNAESRLSLASAEESPRYIDSDEIWRLVGTIQLHLGNHKEAKEALDHAMTKDNKDHRTQVMLARSCLSAPPPNHQQALHFAMDQGSYHIHYYDRVLALAHLGNGHYREAIEAAKKTLDDDEFPSFRYLIIAIAEAKLERAREASAALEQASTRWPADLEEKKTVVTFNNEFLWIEEYKELLALRQEAENAVRGGMRPHE